MAKVVRRITPRNRSTARGLSATLTREAQDRGTTLASGNSACLRENADKGPVNPGSLARPSESKRSAGTLASNNGATGSPHTVLETDEPGREGAEGVGYGKPPRHSRFKPGQSGNPKGRTKNIKNFTTILKEELETLVEVTENGRRRKLSKGQLAIKALVLKAVKGDQRAMAEIFRQGEKQSQQTKEMQQTSPDTADDEASALSPMRQLILEYFAPHKIEAQMGPRPSESHPVQANQRGDKKEAKP